VGGKGRVIFGLMTLAVLAGIIYLKIWSGQAATVSINHTAVKADVSEPNASRTLTTKQFSASVPSTMQVKSQNDTRQGPLLLQMLLASPSSSFAVSSADQLAITVGVLPPGGITDISGVQYRLRLPAQYQKTTYGGLSAGTIVFEQSDTLYELSAFWPQGSRYASVVYTASVDHKAAAKNQLLQVLNSWQWQP
jgi:hypothetical protein